MERWREYAGNAGKAPVDAFISQWHLHSKTVLSWLVGIMGLAILVMAIFWPEGGRLMALRDSAFSPTWLAQAL